MAGAGVVFFAENRLESAVSVAVSPAEATGKPITRIYDRDRTFQYVGGSAAQTDIDLVQTSAQPISGLALINHNLAGITLSIRGDASAPATTERATLAVTGADALLLFVSPAFVNWRIRIPAMAGAPQIGELLFGTPRLIRDSPFYDSSPGPDALGNVRVDEGAGGYEWGVRLGVKRAVLGYGWPSITAEDKASLEAAYDDCLQRAKPMLVKDPFGVLRWMRFTNERLTAKRKANGRMELAIELKEVL